MFAAEHQLVGRADVGRKCSLFVVRAEAGVCEADGHVVASATIRPAGSKYGFEKTNCSRMPAVTGCASRAAAAGRARFRPGAAGRYCETAEVVHGGPERGS